jgi:hypothetical protein
LDGIFFCTDLEEIYGGPKMIMMLNLGNWTVVIDKEIGVRLYPDEETKIASFFE